MNKKIEEEKLISILYANFQGKKRKINDWMFLAENIKKLSDFYGSHKKLAQNLGISNELIRETLKLLELPKYVQELVKNNKIKHEVAWRISSIKGNENQVRVAKAIIGLNTHEARDVARIFRNNPNMNIEDYVEKLKKSKSTIEDINLVILPMKKTDYVKIKKFAEREGMTPERLMINYIVKKFLKSDKN